MTSLALLLVWIGSLAPIHVLSPHVFGTSDRSRLLRQVLPFWPVILGALLASAPVLAIFLALHLASRILDHVFDHFAAPLPSVETGADRRGIWLKTGR